MNKAESHLLYVYDLVRKSSTTILQISSVEISMIAAKSFHFFLDQVSEFKLTVTMMTPQVAH